MGLRGYIIVKFNNKYYKVYNHWGATSNRKLDIYL